MKKRNRLPALILSAALTLSPLTPAAAAEAIPAQADNTATVAFQVAPRYDHISLISSSLSINDLGRANCTGVFNPYDDYDSTMTLTLQRYKDGVWTDIKEWSQDFTGAKVHAMEKGHYVPSGYRYRVVTVVQIFNSNGKVLETVSCDSPIKDY